MKLNNIFSVVNCNNSANNINNVKNSSVPIVSSEESDNKKPFGRHVNSYQVNFRGSAATKMFIDSLDKSTLSVKKVFLDNEDTEVKSYNKNGIIYFQTDDGKLYRVKYSKNQDKNAQTVLAGKLYNLAGVKSPEMKLLKDGEMNGYITEYKPNVKDASLKPELLYDAFATDAWVGNWNTYDSNNTGIDEDGNLIKLVTSGSLTYRASGKKKDKFDASVAELDSMRNPATNPQGAMLLKKMSNDDLKASINKVVAIEDKDIIYAVKHSHVEDKDELTNTLIARRDYLKNHLETVLKAPVQNTGVEDKKVEKPVKVSPVADLKEKQRKSAQLDKYLNGDFIYKKDENSWYYKYQKENINKVEKEIKNSPEKREIFADILDIDYSERKDENSNKDLVYSTQLHEFVGYPTNRLKFLTKLAEYKMFGYFLPLNKPESYSRLNDIPDKKLDKLINYYDLKSVDEIVEKSKVDLDSLDILIEKEKDGIISKEVGLNIAKFAADENGEIPDYRLDAMTKLINKGEFFCEKASSYNMGGPNNLTSEILSKCDTREKTKHIINEVLPKYESIMSGYSSDSKEHLSNILKAKDENFEFEKLEELGREISDYPGLHTPEDLKACKLLKKAGLNARENNDVRNASMVYDKDYENKSINYDVLNKAIELKQDGFNGNLLSEMVRNYSYNKEEALLKINKIKERNLQNLEIKDRYCEDENYIPSQIMRPLVLKEIDFMMNVSLEDFEKMKAYIDTPERKRPFSLEEIYQLIQQDKETLDKINKYNLMAKQNSNKNEFFFGDIVTLGNLDEDALSQMESRDILKPLTLSFDYYGQPFSEQCIILNELSDKEFNNVKKRNLLNKNGLYASSFNYKPDDKLASTPLSTEDVSALAKMDDNSYNEIESKKMFENYTKDSVLGYINFKEFEKYSNINELNIAQKRDLLKKLVKYNSTMFDTDFIALNPAKQLLPKNKEEYCSLLPNLVKSIGVLSTPWTKEIKENYYNSMENLSKVDGKFLKLDLEKPGFKLDLTYSRSSFMKDVNEKLSKLSEKEQKKATDYFGFEFKTYDDGIMRMNGYPSDNNDASKLAEINSSSTKSVIDDIRENVKKFSENNEIVPNSNISSDLAKDFNNIIKAFPEFITTIGKEQHQTHSYTVDVHTLKVLQGVMKNPEFKKLPDNDKKALETATLLHDLTKLENKIDKTHPDYSAYDAYYISRKMALPKNERIKIYQLIKNHDWLEKYTSINAKDYAFELRQGNNFKMECILAEADLKGVARNDVFYNRYKSKLAEGAKKIKGLVDDLQKTSICLPQTKIPKADKIVSDNENVKTEITYDEQNKQIKNKVIYLKNGMDLSKSGFESKSANNLMSEDFNVLVHGLDQEKQSSIFQTLGQIDSDALLSASYVNYKKGNYHVFRSFGFVLDVAGDDINAAYYKDFGSGYGKNLRTLKNQYLYNGSRKEIRNYISEQLKKALNVSDEEYKKLYPTIADKSITELDESNPKAAQALRKIFEEMIEGQRSNDRQYNEVLVSRPKIQAVFWQGKQNESTPYKLEDVPVFLRKYAEEHNIPIINFGA